MSSFVSGILYKHEIRSLKRTMRMVRVTASWLICVACAVTLLGTAAELPMNPFGSEVIWKVKPIRDSYIKDVIADTVPEELLKSSWSNCSKLRECAQGNTDFYVT